MDVYWLLNPDADSSAKFDLAVEMLRFTFPYLLFISLTVLAGAILNTYQRFAAAAFAPVLLSVVMISFAAFVAPNFEEPGIVLAAGVFVAGTSVMTAADMTMTKVTTVAVSRPLVTAKTRRRRGSDSMRCLLPRCHANRRKANRCDPPA